jgi:cell division protein FtsB
MAKEKDKKKRRGNFILRLIITVLVAYSVVALLDMQIQLGQRRQELEALRAQVEAQRLATKDLERELTNELDEDYIERYARDYLDYVAPDETVFIDTSGS